jgi:aminomethyltransferase
VQSQPSGKAFYTLLLNEEAGILDDLIIIRVTDTEFVVVVNAANAVADLKHIRERAPPAVSIEDVTASTAMIAVQGPRAQAALQSLTPTDLGQVKRFRCVSTKVLQQPALVSRTGYTGEDGFEVIVEGAPIDHPEGALMVWDQLAASCAPCGLSSRDSLRLEAGFPLHGFDIDPETNPFQADLGWVVSAEKTGYLGYESVAKLRGSPPDLLKRGVVLDRGIPRHGFEVVDPESNSVGTVTSGSFSPILRKGIALCRVKQGSSELGAEVRVKVRDAAELGRLVRPPFYDETRFGWKRSAK